MGLFILSNKIKEDIKKIYYLLDSQFKKAIPFLIGLFIFSSFLDVIGIGLIGVFAALLIDPSFLVKKVPSIAFLSSVLFGKEAIVIFGIVLICAIAIKSVIIIAIQKKTLYLVQSFNFRLKSKLIKAYQSAPYIYYLHKNSNELMSRIQDNTNAIINNLVMSSLTLISNSLMLCFILLFILYLHPIATLSLLGLFIGVLFLYDFFIKKDLSSVGKIVAASSGDINKSIRHTLHGIAEIRVLGKETYFLEILKEKYRQHIDAGSVIYAQQLIPHYLIENTVAIFAIMVGLVGLFLGYSAISIVTLVGIFGVVGIRLLPIVSQMMTSLNQFRAGYPNLNLIYNEFKEIEQHIQNSKQINLTFDCLDKLEFSYIQINDASYCYPGLNYPVLKDINLKIYKGQSIGLIGPTGVGKSTLINLVLGFLEPQQGQLLVDGNPIKDLRKWLNNFAYIPQSVFLLDDILARNIAFGIEDSKIDNKKLWDAIDMAQLSDVIQHLPDGIDTSVGENGIRFSGGQRQRIALARAFYSERDIIVMDEATSALDNETEKEVINTIKQLKGKKTLIVIAHRLSTVEHCDILYRLENGIISKVGSFDEVVGSI